MSQNLTRDQIDHFREAFNVFDSDGSGSIDASELGSCLRALGQNMSDQELEDLIISVDEDRSGSIEFEEFLAMITRKTEAMSCDQEMLRAFEEFDLARSGRISKDDFFGIMCTMGDPLKPAEFERMLAVFADAVDTATDEVIYSLVVRKLLSM
uniref:EF-hand domain-containing protein n=2 Tax=Hemiselmis TaxID=77924 RepID=A0A6U5AYY7_HEMAN|mmetsp:Transcript_4778/g.11056  ORF Transcript_4778/g.11056 Transcript_4778/m.11056 type:complete len:153 (-) Transcript_4778:27-485(-)|eukprot:CAMPEP_0174917972 /NCGR_PEP_ID=MMETSP1355-20121228/2821_1 /TAXON_ID=464990 /ORGANISM="Hemiselmis tepida, Strain CCMP443" /LENGTH=152 /DNA_ID=CAMNT_0016163127 /DNA_START=71 /DNA_END=529 /DNA_ORIENTATION=+